MLSKRERMIAIGVGVAVGLLALDYFVIEPISDARSKLSLEQASLNQQLAHANAIRVASAKAAKRWKDFRAAGLATDASTTESRLLNSIRSWAQESNLTLASIRPDRVTDDHGISELAFQATAEGSLRSVTDFLYKVQTAKMPVRIRELQIASRVEGNDDLTLQLHISTLWEDRPVVGPATTVVEKGRP